MRVAVIIAANGPLGENRLRFAERDGERMAFTLQQPRCAYEVRRLPRDGDAYAARKLLFDTASELGPNDTLLVYFAGHGVVDGGALWLLLNPSDPNKILATALPAADVMLSLQRCLAKSRLLILDCCNAGTLVRQQGLRGDRVPVQELNLSFEGFEAILASDYLEFAREYEELRGGFLSSTLDDALREHFVEADSNEDGALSVEEAVRWLETEAIKRRESDLSGFQLPIPKRFGVARGTAYITRPPEDWIVHEIPGPDGIPLVVVPIAPFDIASDYQGAIVLGKYPVTNRAYRQYTQATGSPEPRGQRLGPDEKWTIKCLPWREPDLNDPDQPVVCISAAQAVEYSQWLSSQGATSSPRRRRIRRSETADSSDFYLSKAGRRRSAYFLPPLPEVWDAAAFGTPYPSWRQQLWLSLSKSIHDKTIAPAQCGTAPPERTNKFGFTDMIGNVWEWCASREYWDVVLKQVLPYYGWIRFHDKNGHREFSAFGKNYSSTGEMPLSEAITEIRGGGFYDDLRRVIPKHNVSRLEDGAETCHSSIGFRVAGLIDFDILPVEVKERLRGRQSLLEWDTPKAAPPPRY